MNAFAASPEAPATKPDTRRGTAVKWLGEIALSLAALAILWLLAARGWSVMDRAWDATGYHLPYAARLAGLCDRNCLQFFDTLEIRYASFPLAVEFLQGWLWRLTGRVEAANLVSLAALCALILFLRLARGVSLRWALLALTAIPFVQMMASSVYIDLTTNALATIGILTVFGLVVEPERTGDGEILAFCAALAVLGNAKLQMAPLAAMLFVGFLALAATTATQRPGRLFRPDRPLAFALSALILGALTFASLARNAFLFGNPLYPVDIVMFGRQILVGVEPPVSNLSVPAYLETAHPALRWAMSVLEVSAFDGRNVPYVIDQGNVAKNLPSFRMGGYFAPYVLLCLWFAGQAMARLERRGAKIFALFMALTLATALMPAAHELRYYLYWMLTLASLNLMFYASPRYDAMARGDLARAFKASVCACLMSVVALTGGHYMRAPAGESFADAARDGGFAARVRDHIAPGAAVCVDQVEMAFYYSSFLYGRDDYKVLQDFRRHPDDDPGCTVKF